MKFIRSIIGANLLLIFVFAFLPVLMFKPDVEIMQSFLAFLTKES